MHTGGVRLGARDHTNDRVHSLLTEVDNFPGQGPGYDGVVLCASSASDAALTRHNKHRRAKIVILPRLRSTTHVFKYHVLPVGYWYRTTQLEAKLGNLVPDSERNAKTGWSWINRWLFWRT